MEFTPCDTLYLVKMLNILFDPIEADKIKITASCGFCGGNIKISEVKILGR